MHPGNTRCANGSLRSHLIAALVAASARDVPVDMSVEEQFPGVDHEQVFCRLRRAADSISVGRVIMIKLIKLSACTSAR